MKSLFFPLMCILLVSCDRFNSDSALAISPKVKKITPIGITSVDEIIQPGIKTLDNKELTVFYKIIVDTSDNEELLREKMYQLQRKLKLSFARQFIDFNKSGSFTYIIEREPSIIDRASQKITKDGGPSFPIDFCLNRSVPKFDMIPTNYVPVPVIRFDCRFPSCPLTSSDKSVVLIVETYQSKQVADSMLTLVKKYEKNAYLAIESFHFISEIFEQNDLVSNQ
jgi:hypothetical protein